MSDDLRNIGLCTRESLKISEISKFKDELYGDFLIGYFDGDGSITKYVHTFKKGSKLYSYNKGKMCIIATEGMLKEFIDRFNITKYHISNSKEMKYIQIEAKSELLRLYKIMYNDCSIYNKSKKK